MTHHTHQHPDHAEMMRSRDEVLHAFGGAGGALLDELVRQFGPILAQIILNWLLKQQQAGQVPQHALADMAGLRHFVAGQLRSHRQEILDAANAQTARLFDAGIAALDQ